MSDVDLVFKTKDHPEANGREPQKGESMWALTFPLECGRSLRVEMGKQSFETLTQFLFDMLSERPSYNDDEKK